MQFILSQNSENLLSIAENNNEIESSVDENFQKYLMLVDAHELIQKKLVDSLNYYNKISNKNYVLTGKDIKNLSISFSKRIALLNETINFADRSNGLNFDKVFNNLIATHLKIKALETYLIQQDIVAKNAKINNLVNEENKLYRQEKNSLKKIKRNIISRKYRRSILEAWNNTNVFERNTLNEIKNRNIKSNIVITAYHKNYLSNSTNIKKSKIYFRNLIDKKNSFYAKVNFNNFINTIFSGFSNVVSNFLGIFASRKGKLSNNEEFINRSLKLLQPLDIILEKTPFRLTDKFIPGYWGHAAIYIGNEAQLKKLGIWDNIFVKKFHVQISKGNVIIEALRSKVELNTFKNFSNIDDYAHLRLNEELTLEKKREMIIRTFAQIGKKYDFGYDVESSKKIICSELHYITFDEVVFKTSKFMGINSVSVDQIAEQGLKGGAFYPIDLYLDSIKIEEDKIIELYELLPKARNKEIRKLKKSLH